MDEVSKTKDSQLIFLPYLSGERSPINDPLARGALIGLNLSHTRGDISRAIINGINLGLLDNLFSINSLKIKPTSARVVGGGAKSKL
jgi:xylulokinase